LRKLLMPPFRKHIAESIRADDRARVDDHTVTDLHTGIERNPTRG
jgi:hypothetical protein